jgi:hypothetical protein
MTTISERRQHIDFDASWRVCKWDESSEFIGSMSSALNDLPGNGVKAADVIGIDDHPNRPRTILVAEFKDYDHPRAETNRQATSSESIRDVVRKIIDTLAGVTFAHDTNDERRGELAGWRRALALSKTTVLVLVCVEAPSTQAAMVVNTWTTELQRRLRWLGPDAQILVTNSATPFRGQGIAYRVH